MLAYVCVCVCKASGITHKACTHLWQRVKWVKWTDFNILPNISRLFNKPRKKVWTFSRYVNFIVFFYHLFVWLLRVLVVAYWLCLWLQQAGSLCANSQLWHVGSSSSLAFVHSQSDLTLRPHGLYPAWLLCPGNFPGKTLEWVAISFSRGSSWPTDQTCVSCLWFDQGSNPGPLHWELGVLATEPPRKSLHMHF